MSKNDRFQIVQEEGNGLTSNRRMVLADTTTGVQYLLSLIHISEPTRP